MIEIGVFHNGASDLPTITTPDQVEVNDGTLGEVHESTQRVLLDQIRQGILADRLGFNYLFMTEHHFQPEGAEFSPNPLLAETGDCCPHRSNTARPSGEHHNLVASNPNRRASGDARRD